MSEESKTKIEHIKKNVKLIQEVSEQIKKMSDPLGDKELSTKIKKISEGCSEVVEHIQKRSN